MKKTIFPLLVGAMLSVGIAASAQAQSNDPVVTIQPQAEVYASGPVVSGHVTSGAPIVSSGAIDPAYRHPAPIYSRSPRGHHATGLHHWNEQQAMMYPWHGSYYHYQYGVPLALVVPPTATFQTNYSWGVGNTTSTPIYHQFARPYPGMPTGGPHGLHRTPYWPSNTNQFGVYYIRGPW